MELGRGAFSRVLVDGADAAKAVKVIDVDDQRPPHNWRAEVAALRALHGCAHVVPLLDLVESKAGLDREVRLVMPRYQFTLEELIFREAKAKWPVGSGWRNVMPPAKIAQVIGGLAAALAAAAEFGIIHRDLKPANVMFDTNSSGTSEAETSVGGTATRLDPILLDFGIAFVPYVRAEFESAESMVTDVGTAEYKAPELLYGVRKYDAKIDIWSLGCIAARLLSADSQPLFSPYTTDIGLIAAQFELLGRPVLIDCPSLQGSAVEGMTSGTVPNSNFKLERLPNDPAMQKLFAITQKMLNYEPTKRPTATEVLKAINEM